MDKMKIINGLILVALVVSACTTTTHKCTHSNEQTENTRIRRAVLDHFAKIKRKIFNKNLVKIGPLTDQFVLAEDYRIKIIKNWRFILEN